MRKAPGHTATDRRRSSRTKAGPGNPVREGSAAAEHDALRSAVFVDHGQAVLPRRRADGDFVFERGRTDVVVVDMPEQHGIAVAVHGRKDKALLFPFERPRGDQHTPRLRVDDVDGIVFGPVTRQAGMQRGQRSVVGDAAGGNTTPAQAGG